MPIRPESPPDEEAIDLIQREAFAVHPYSRQTEHLIVAELRKAGALTLSLVADVETPGGQATVGHIAFSPLLIDSANCGWQILGPVGVRPAWQRQGIGTELVRAGLARLRATGARGCLLVGDPALYTRFGFAAHAQLLVPGVPPEYVLSLAFSGAVPAGTATHHAAFNVAPES